MQVRKTYRVAGNTFSFVADEERMSKLNLDNYAPFEAEGGENLFSVELVNSLEIDKKEKIYVSAPESGEQRIDLYSIDGGYLFEMSPEGNMPVTARLECDPSFTEGRLSTVGKFRNFAVNNALMLMYAFRTATLGTLEMHASVTVKDGKGYLFLAKSGTGKSTHSRMWLENIPGTHLLNDDNPVVRFIDGKTIVFGTPWSGKTPCYRNEEYPVGAFVRINRAPRNAISRLSLPEAFASVSSSSSGLRALKGMGDGLFETISSIVQDVPCYLLDCLPDKEAAQVCCSEVTKGNG